MRLLLGVLVWTLSTALLAPVIFFAVIVFAGPHSSLLPSVIQPVVAVAGLIALVALPVWLTRLTLRRFDRTPR